MFLHTTAATPNHSFYVPNWISKWGRCMLHIESVLASEIGLGFNILHHALSSKQEKDYLRQQKAGLTEPLRQTQPFLRNLLENNDAFSAIVAVLAEKKRERTGGWRSANTLYNCSKQEATFYSLRRSCIHTTEESGHHDWIIRIELQTPQIWNWQAHRERPAQYIKRNRIFFDISSHRDCF